MSTNSKGYSPLGALDALLKELENSAGMAIEAMAGSTGRKVWEGGFQQTATFAARQGIYHLSYKLGSAGIKLAIPQELHSTIDSVGGTMYIIGTSLNVVNYISEMSIALRNDLEALKDWVSEYWSNVETEEDAEAVADKAKAEADEIKKKAEAAKAKAEAEAEAAKAPSEEPLTEDAQKKEAEDFLKKMRKEVEEMEANAAASNGPQEDIPKSGDKI